MISNQSMKKTIYITFFSPIETSDSNREDTNDESEHSVEEESESENSDDGLSYEEKYLNEVQNIGEKRPRAMSDRFEAGANVVSDYCFATSLITDIDEPSSVEEAMSDPDWMQAMRSEMSSLHDNQTWELVPRPSGKNVVKSKWLFKIKRNADGSISRYKARLVAQGYSQEQGIDYQEVFSPVARAATIRSLLAVANIHDLEIHQMDVTTAFLNGDLDYEIFMAQPKGFVDSSKPDHVCELKKGSMD